ncbi:MAG: flavodoxin [Bacteroidota bacterium]
MSAIKDLKVGLFWGSDTGNTEEITNLFTEKWQLTELTSIEACDMSVQDYAQYDFIFLGLPTWYDGDLQSDFEDFFDDFKTIDFTGKVVAMYGLGDQYGYAEYFVDGLGILGKIIQGNGGKVIGFWSREGYDDDIDCIGVFNEKLFWGLAIDEDNQAELTEERLDDWIAQVEREMKALYEPALAS